MFEPLLLKPLIALIFVAISCGSLGAIMLWKKLAYFGDALSHSILLGLLIGSLLNLNQILSLIIFAIAFAALLQSSIENRFFSKDTMIAIFSYSFLALALILNDFFNNNFDFSTVIFGDVLTVDSVDIITLSIIAVISLIFTFFNYKKILLININQDLALIHGLKCNVLSMAFLALLSVVIALSVKIIGIFLMTAFLVLPAAISRLICASAKSMLFYSIIISCLVCLASIEFSTHLNLSINSSLIGLLSLVFMLTFLNKKYGKF